MNVLTQRLAIMFGPPEFSGDPEAYCREIDRLTKGYHTNELEKAADHLVRVHKPTQRRPWPSPAEICDACEDAREISNPIPRGGVAWGEWQQPAVNRANSLIKCELGRRAANEGWILSLWDYCRKHSELPGAADIARLQRDARGFDEAYGQVSAKQDGLSLALSRLGQTMLKRRDALARLAHGADADGVVFDTLDYSEDKPAPDRKTQAAGGN